MIKVNGIKLEIGHFPDGTILTKYDASFSERAKSQTHEIVWHFENNEEMVALMYITRHLQTHGVRNIFTYRQLNEYIRTRRCDDPAIRELIDKKHRQNLFKLQLMPSFKCEYLTSY